MISPATTASFRKYHRWIGFFLSGIMLIYALSGTLLIFRTTEFLKFPATESTVLPAGLSDKALASKLRMKSLTITREEGAIRYFEQGYYNAENGQTEITRLAYPLVLDKLVRLHKATTNSPLFILNIAFGIALLFFVLSAFLMFLPRVRIFKNNMLIAGAGAVFALLVVIFGS